MVSWLDGEVVSWLVVRVGKGFVNGEWSLVVGMGKRNGK